MCEIRLKIRKYTHLKQIFTPFETRQIIFFQSLRFLYLFVKNNSITSKVKFFFAKMKSQKTTLPSRYIVVKYDAPLPRLYLVCWTKTTLLSVVEGSEFYNYSNPVCLPTKTSTHALKLVYIFVCLQVYGHRLPPAQGVLDLCTLQELQHLREETGDAYGDSRPREWVSWVKGSL